MVQTVFAGLEKVQVSFLHLKSAGKWLRG